jgi:DNA (cytosine-5)-methyltransferase 1
MDYTKKSREELLAFCKEKGVKGYSGKKKNELVELLKGSDEKVVAPVAPAVEPVTESTKLRMIDLFAGTGAFTHAFQSTGQVQCVFANDMVEWSKTIYDANFDHKLTLKNLNDIPVEEIPGHDILTGGFPCFVAGTKVLTNNGYKPIETVTLEDKLMTHTGKYQTILNRQIKQGATSVQSVQIMYHPHAIDATEEHPFYVKEFGNPVPTWIPAKELTVNHYVAMPQNTKSVVPNFMSNKPEEWFQLGSQFAKSPDTKLIPEWVQDAPVECVKEFLKGYLTSDGLQNQTSHTMFLDIQRLYAKLGVVWSDELKPYESIPMAIVDEQHIWLKVKSVEEKRIDPQPVYNFEVEHDNSYCVENAIVHNCQPFSIAGRQEGFEDERSNVFWKILSIIDYHNPKCVVLENVKNLVSHDEKRTFETIKTQLENRGYHIRFKVLNTADITGVPQHRERIYIVCFKDKSLYEKFSLDFPDVPKRGVQTCLQDSIPDKYYYKEGSSTWPLLSEAVKKKNTIYQYRRVYVRENKSQECPTLTANMGGGGHNVPIVLDEKGIRKLTPRETFNFQGFPSSYTLPALSDTNLYKLAGNAVSVPVVELIAKRLVPLLSSSG